MKKNNSIFEIYYQNSDFIDRFETEKEGAVDVIIPVIHANELWQANLQSIYREVPVNRLLVSDGGCIDGSIEIVAKLPRVIIFDHRNYVSLGYCLRMLIEKVETEWFIYLHSDVYLPKDWYNTMKNHKRDYDWFGCPQRITALIEYPNVDKLYGEVRPYAGSQMGRKEAFVKGIKCIDDDYVYRQEDLILAKIVEDSGYRNGWIEDTYHYHQVMHKDSPWSRKLKRVFGEVDWSREEQIRASTMQVKGIIKYLQPRPSLRKLLESHILRLLALGEFNTREFKRWVKLNNPQWLPYLSLTKIRINNVLKHLLKIVRRKSTLFLNELLF